MTSHANKNTDPVNRWIERTFLPRVICDYRRLFTRPSRHKLEVFLGQRYTLYSGNFRYNQAKPYIFIPGAQSAGYFLTISALNSWIWSGSFWGRHVRGLIAMTEFITGCQKGKYFSENHWRYSVQKWFCWRYNQSWLVEFKINFGYTLYVLYSEICHDKAPPCNPIKFLCGSISRPRGGWGGGGGGGVTRVPFLNFSRSQILDLAKATVIFF